MKLLNIKLIIAFFLASSISAFAIPKTIDLGSYGKGKAWQAQEYDDAGSKVCFMFSNPIATKPKGLNRDSHSLMITNYTVDNTKHEASIETGFPFKPNSSVELIIGSNQYKFFTLETRAWLADDENVKQMIKDMKNGARVKVKSISSRGTKVTDTYSLIGFTKALAAIDKACS